MYGSVWYTSYGNDIRKVLRMFIFESFVGKAKFCEPVTKL